MATTQLMSVVNNTGSTLAIDFLEDDKHDAKIDDNHAREFFHPPIPWCSSDAEFKKKGLTIITAMGTYAVWQDNSSADGDRVRWSADGSWKAADTSNRIPGDSQVGGWIYIVVEKGGIRSCRLDHKR